MQKSVLQNIKYWPSWAKSGQNIVSKNGKMKEKWIFTRFLALAWTFFNTLLTSNYHYFKNTIFTFLKNGTKHGKTKYASKILGMLSLKLKVFWFAS